MPPSSGFSSVLEDLLNGSLRPKTDMKRVLDEVKDAAELKDVYQKKRPELKVFVVATTADIFTGQADNFDKEISMIFDCRVFRVANCLQDMKPNRTSPSF
eukprot:m.275473 g.275473  ORF g.275473 m.275473 type:complete len:100 (+) comp40600_c0_seq6:273-572(+)